MPPGAPAPAQRDEQRGAEIDKQNNSKGFTALTAAAASQGHEWVVDLLSCICLQRDREAALQRVCCECPCVKRVVFTPALYNG